MPSEKEKMLAGDLYDAGDPELSEDSARCQRLLRLYNDTSRDDAEARRALLAPLLGRLGTGAVLRAPLHLDYGYNLFVGDGVFANFGLTVLDVCPVTIGDRTQIGPGVQLYAADHPRDAGTRAAGLENGLPVTIGADVWIGGHAIVLPGVSVGDGAIIGAGSVVTRNVAPGATVVGNPARAVRTS